mmetsp:Transcript_15603/g.13646  ORF Transcript_15603/g.13646 Transcript_15603/m.13646 type:complete len:158 (+) Transcript_15603:224-697(+)
MNSLSISKQNDGTDKENNSPSNNTQKSSEEEEVIQTQAPRNARIKRNKRRAKRIDDTYMSAEKEEYLSRLANVADMISSSSSEPDNDDDDFDIGGIIPESDSGLSDNSSLIHSSQVSSNVTPAKESDFSDILDMSSNNKKYMSSVATFSSKKKKSNQ